MAPSIEVLEKGALGLGRSDEFLPRLRAAVETALAIEEYPLPPELVTVAGVVALELANAPAPERRALVQRHMAKLRNGTTDKDYAYQVIRAYAAR